MWYQSDCSIFKTVMGSSAIASSQLRLLTTFPAKVYSITEYGDHEYAELTKVNFIHIGMYSLNCHLCILPLLYKARLASTYC